jgi:hypothetical protein
MTIKHIGPLSCAKIAGVIYACLGLIVGALISVFAAIGFAFGGAQPGLGERSVSPLIGTVVGIGAVIFLPIFYGAIGFVFALLGAWLYNMVASKVGGIEIDIS